MKTPNTPENKAKFFALYWGQRLMCIPRKRDTVKVEVSYLNESKLDEYLELRPLHSITDDEAIEVAKLLWKNWDLTNPKPVIKLITEYLSGEIEATRLFNVISVADYLRSNAFALPFHDLSVQDLQDYGWVKLTD